MEKWKIKKNPKKVIFLLLSFSLFAYKVHAETMLDCSNNNCNYEVSIKNESSYNYYNTLKEAISTITSSKETTIYLVKNTEIDSAIDINPGLNITIDGQGKYQIKRKSSSDYNGTFFNLLTASSEEPSKITIKNLTIDAGANIQINKTAIKTIENTTPSVATSILENDYFNISSDSKTSSSSLLTIGGYTNLVLYNTNIQNFHSTNAIMLNVAANGNLLLQKSNIQNNYLSNSSRLSSLNGTLKLSNNSSINNNYIISNGGIAFGEISNGTLSINDTSSIRNNLIINASNVFRIRNDGNVFINEDMKDGKYQTNGAKISNNISYPGPNTSTNTFFYNYNTNSGTFIMYGGEITNNIGGNYVIMDQRRPLDILKLESGIIKNNKSVYDKGIIISMRGSDVGKNMIIEDSTYIRLGGTDDLHYFNNEGIMNGNILISQLSGTFKNTGVINGNVTVDSAYSSTPTTFTGTINGTMTFQNNANGLITGIVNNDIYINSNSKLEITGTINGNIYVDMTNNTNEQPMFGTGTVNGYIIYKYDSNSSLPTDNNELNIQGNVIKYNPQNDVLITIDYNGEKDNKGNEYSIISTPIDSIVDLSNIEFSNTSKDFDTWYKDKNLTTKWDYKATEETTIYAKWIEHQHSFKLEEHENVIYKICKCGKKEEYIKLEEPQDSYYNGEEKEISIVTETTSNYTVKYQKLNEKGEYEDIEGIPKEIGEYKAILEYENLLIEETYEIINQSEDSNNNENKQDDSNLPTENDKEESKEQNEDKIENPFTSDKMMILSISLLLILTSLILVLLYLRKKSKGKVYYT